MGMPSLWLETLPSGWVVTGDSDAASIPGPEVEHAPYRPAGTS